MVGNGFKTFNGFKNIIEDYKNGYKSYDNIVKEQIKILKSPNFKENSNDNSNDNIEFNINIGYNIILNHIRSNKINFDKKEIIRNIIDADSFLKDKPYYITYGKNDNTKIYKYNNELNKFINFIDNNEVEKIKIDLLDNKLNKIGSALDMITSDTDKNEVPIIDRDYAKLLYFTYLQIINYVKGEQYFKKQGEGLKIITPKQMLSRLPVLLSEIHPGNNSTKLKNEIRQLLYSLYRSKKISKTVYNNLIATM